MRISDWSSDVCSSDLFAERMPQRHDLRRRPVGRLDPAAGRLDRPDRGERAPGAAVENIDVALFARQYERGNGAFGARIIDQRRLRAEAIIPDIILDRLKMPAGLAGRYVESDARGRLFT